MDKFGKNKLKLLGESGNIRHEIHALQPPYWNYLAVDWLGYKSATCCKLMLGFQKLPENLGNRKQGKEKTKGIII